MPYRVGIITKKGTIVSNNFLDKITAEAWVLSMAEDIEIKKAIIINKDDLTDKEIINFEDAGKQGDKDEF